MEIGKVLITNTIQDLIINHKIRVQDLVKSCIKMELNDFGDICEEDREYQWNCLYKYGDTGDQMLGVYYSKGIKYWIINADSSIGRCTTIMLPDEY